MELVQGEERVDASLALLDVIAVTESRLYAMRCQALVDLLQGAREVDERAAYALASEFLPLHVAGTLTVRQSTARQLLDEARLFTSALRRLAEQITTAGDERTAAQREADVLAALPGLVLHGLTAGPSAVQDRLSGHGLRPGGRPAELSAVVLGQPVAPSAGSAVRRSHGVLSTTVVRVDTPARVRISCSSASSSAGPLTRTCRM